MANARYLKVGTNGTEEQAALSTSAGAGDADKIIQTNAQGKVDESLLPSGYGPDMKIYMASEDLGAGSFVSFWDDTGTIKIRKADASAANAGKPVDGYILGAVLTGATAAVYFEGINDQLSGLTPTKTYYLSATTAGTISDTPPAVGSGHILQEVGTALSATELSYEREPWIIRN